MREERTSYDVPGWGTGTLWMAGGLVLAHEFDYALEEGAVTAGLAGPGGDDAHRAPGAVRAAPYEGAQSPPGVTVVERCSQVEDGGVPSVRRSLPDPARGGRLDPAAVVARVRSFFAGEDTLADVPLDLGSCTPFQRSVAVTLRRVARGEVVSYGELAALAGYPNAQRAVGTFCARNRFPLLLPCHRVVAADGIGGYGSTGVDVKRGLLALEGIFL